eukprot:6470236-Amphidinium_carterae.1
MAALREAYVKCFNDVREYHAQQAQACTEEPALTFIRLHVTRHSGHATPKSCCCPLTNILMKFLREAQDSLHARFVFIPLFASLCVMSLLPVALLRIDCGVAWPPKVPRYPF